MVSFSCLVIHEFTVLKGKDGGGGGGGGSDGDHDVGDDVDDDLKSKVQTCLIYIWYKRTLYPLA